MVTPSRSPGLRSEVVRESNLSTILRNLHLAGDTSRADLGAHTGLTRSSVGALVGDLCDFGMVAEERATPDGSPGRPSTVVRPVPQRNAVISVAVLVDSIAVSAIGLGGVSLCTEQVDRPRSRTSIDQTVIDIGELYRKVVAQLDPVCSVYGIGVAVPGLVRRSDNMIVLAPNVGWSDLALSQRLLDEFGADLPVVVENEAAVAALAESRRGAATEVGDVLCLWGEVGIGGGIVSNGTLMQGASGFAGEIGHVPINLEGSLCGCGATGCLETELGEGKLLRRAGRDPDGGRVALSALFADATAGLPTALDALAEHGRWLGIGLAGMVNMLDPDAVVLGGFLGDALPHLEATMQAELESRALRAIYGSLEVVASTCGPHAPLMGAAELAWDSVIESPLHALDDRVPATALMA